jgi:predicted transcriptional regulator
MSRLRLSKGLAAFFLIFIITISFEGLIQKQKIAVSLNMSSQGASEYVFDLLTFPTTPNFLHCFVAPVVFDVKIAETPSSVLCNTTRAEIYDFIKTNPGVQFRGICNQLGLSIGLAQFHLGVLKKAGLISFFRDGRYKRFFESNRFSNKEMKMLSLLRRDTAKMILKTVLRRKSISHSELSHELSVTSQGLTWQMNRLEEEGIVQESKQGLKIIYSLKTAYRPVVFAMMALMEQT